MWKFWPFHVQFEKTNLEKSVLYDSMMFSEYFLYSLLILSLYYAFSQLYPFDYNQNLLPTTKSASNNPDLRMMMLLYLHKIFHILTSMSWGARWPMENVHHSLGIMFRQCVLYCTATLCFERTKARKVFLLKAWGMTSTHSLMEFRGRQKKCCNVLCVTGCWFFILIFVHCKSQWM